MRPESNFWSKWRRRQQSRQVLGHWQRVEVKLPLGFPDCVVLLPDRVIFVELKAVDRESELRTALRAEQAVWIDNWNIAGGDAYILAHIKSQGRALWYNEGRMMRQGFLHQVPVPEGVYSAGYTGQV